jgi:hypothetical protein
MTEKSSIQYSFAFHPETGEGLREGSEHLLARLRLFVFPQEFS